MILLFANVTANVSNRNGHRFHGIFALGYLAAWTGFSAWRSGTMDIARTGDAFTDDGEHQPDFGRPSVAGRGDISMDTLEKHLFEPLPVALEFFDADWREGKAGAFTMGLKHGAYCTGCCWVLMALLFVAGVHEHVVGGHHFRAGAAGGNQRRKDCGWAKRPGNAGRMGDLDAAGFQK